MIILIIVITSLAIEVSIAQKLIATQFSTRKTDKITLKLQSKVDQQILNLYSYLKRRRIVNDKMLKVFDLLSMNKRNSCIDFSDLIIVFSLRKPTKLFPHRINKLIDWLFIEQILI
jgi:hypothetical protein